MSKFEEVIETLKSAEKNKEQITCNNSTLHQVITSKKKR